MTEQEKKNLEELSTIPILENELMWICRVIDEQNQDNPDSNAMKHNEPT